MPTEKEIVDLWTLPGESYESVAKKLFISRDRVATVIRKTFPGVDLARMKLLNNPDRITDEVIADAYRKTPMAYEKLGKQLGVSTYRVCNAVNAVIGDDERRAIRRKVQKSLVTNGTAKKVRAAKPMEWEEPQEPGRIIVGPIHVGEREHFVLKAPVAGESLMKFAYRMNHYGFFTEKAYPDREAV